MTSLIINKFDYIPFGRESVDGVRLYSCPDGTRLPSVTTILSKTLPPEKLQSLKEWRNRVGEEKANEITSTAAATGSRMHKNLEVYLETGALPDAGTNPYSKLGIDMAQTVITNGLVNVDEFWGSEVALYYPELYAGATDAVGVHKGSEAIIDFKQSNKPKLRSYVDDYFHQVVFYGMAHNHLFNTNIQKGVIMICVKPNEISPGKWHAPVYQEFIIEGDEWRDYEIKVCDRIEQYYRLTQ